MKDIRELLKEAREAAHYADEYAGERELWTRVADALEAQAKEIEELKKELNAWHESANWPEKSPGRMRARIAELEAVLKPFATLPTHGEYGGPLVQARVYYECEPNDRCGIVHINKTAFRAARAALNGEKT